MPKQRITKNMVVDAAFKLPVKEVWNRSWSKYADELGVRYSLFTVTAKIWTDFAKRSVIKQEILFRVHCFSY